MCALVTEAIDAGAAGFSTSFAYTHRGMDGKPVPSRFAERDEVEALFLAAGRTGKGVVLATAGEQCTYADMYELQPRIGRPFTYPLFALADGRAPAAARRCTRRRWRAGAQVWPQVTPRPLTMQFTLASPFSLNVEHGLRRAHGRATATRASPRTAIPTWRARAAADLEQVADAAALGDLRGLRVGRGSPSWRAGGSTSSRASAAAARST